MDPKILGAAIALVKKIPGSAAAEAVAAANRSEAAAQSVEESAEAIEVFENTGITMLNGKLCVKVERG